MAKQKIRHEKFADKIINRALARWNRPGHGDAVRYLVASLGQIGPDVQCAILTRLPPAITEPLAPYLQKAKNKRLQRAAEAQAAIDARAAAAERAAAHVAKLKADYAQFRDMSDIIGDNALVGFLAGLPPKERNSVAAPAERRAAIALRKRCVMTGAVRKALGCTLAELNRWDADGRLPHVFKRVIHYERATECRFWSSEMIGRATDLVADWREQDKKRRVAK